MRRRAAVWLTALLGAAVPTTGAVPPSSPRAPVRAEAASRVSERGSGPLRPLSRDDLTRSGARGEGCTFLAGRAREMLVSMSGRRGVARAGGRLVALAPAEDAGAMFPGTFDRWRGGGLELRVTELQGDADAGPESVETAAVLEIVAAARVRRVVGRLDCGS